MLAVAIDITLVLALLVPAAMHLMGHAKWWAPRPLARAYDRFGVREQISPHAAVLPAIGVPAQDSRSTIPA